MQKRIKLSRKKGWRKPPEAIVVSRPTRWGNPFDWQELGSKKAATDLYRAWLIGDIDEYHARRDWILAHIHELRGKDLCCWCKPDEPCHADVLIELANKTWHHHKTSV